jgi:adhesin/invasin
MTPIVACLAGCTPGGSTQSIVTITVRDAFNNPINGASVAWAATGTGNTLTNASGTTDALGVFNAGRFSSTVAQTRTISATINGSVAISPNGLIVVNPDVVSLTNSIVTATSPITASSGGSVSSVTVTVTDQFGNGISGRTVTIAVSPVTGNTVTQPASLTNASGVTTGSFFTTQAATKTVTASVTGAGTITTPGHGQQVPRDRHQRRQN